MLAVLHEDFVFRVLIQCHVHFPVSFNRFFRSRAIVCMFHYNLPPPATKSNKGMYTASDISASGCQGSKYNILR